MRSKSLTRLGKQLPAMAPEAVERIQVQSRRLADGMEGRDPMERLQQVFEVVDLALAEQPDLWQRVEGEGIQPLYEAGSRIYKRKEAKLNLLKEQWNRRRFETPNIYYNGAFTRKERAGKWEYTTSRPLEGEGICRAENYVEAVCLETSLLNQFDPARVDALLRGFNTGYGLLPINLLEPVLAAALGCVLLGKAGHGLQLQPEECHALREQLRGVSCQACRDRLLAAWEKLALEVQPGAAAYAREAVGRIAAAIHWGGTVFYAASLADSPKG